MIITNHRCTGCMACYNSCSCNAISICQDSEGFYIPVIKDESCILCGKCTKICPLNQQQVYDEPSRDFYLDAYACYNKNESVREKSSSGGMFSTLSNYIWDNAGIVYCAEFDNNYKVIHERHSVKTEAFMGSKYVQSYIGEIYKNVLEDLKCGKKVLFSGTPCQVAGLKSFLGKNWDNLYTVDFICHGVPSPLLWEKYVESFSIKSDNVDVSFRSKIKSWNCFSFTLTEAESGRVLLSEDLSENVYLKCFLKNISVSIACGDCHFKAGNMQSDITLADFWGVEKVFPDVSDNKGMSLCLINTIKGQELYNRIQTEVFERKITSYTLFIDENPTFLHSSKISDQREAFFTELNKTHDVNKLLKKYASDGWIKKTKKIVKRLCQKTD